jgi:hypothetical membrane protein
MNISNGKIRALAICGILSPIVYFITVALGGFLDPSYSQIGKTVSELVQRGAPNRDLLNSMLIVYNVLIIPFAVGLYFGLKKGLTRSIVMVALVLTAIFSTAVTAFFPLDAGGQSITFTGMMHLIVVGLVVPCTFAFELGFWNSARKDERWGKLGLISVALFIVTLISGIATVAFVNSDYRGLVERITIGSTLLWIEVVAAKLYFITKKQL